MPKMFVHVLRLKNQVLGCNKATYADVQQVRDYAHVNVLWSIQMNLPLVCFTYLFNNKKVTIFYY